MPDWGRATASHWTDEANNGLLDGKKDGKISRQAGKRQIPSGNVSEN